jgi:hypothetical protein
MSSQTKPMKIGNAEACLGLTVAALSSVLSIKDQGFLENAMRTYGDKRVQEAERKRRRQGVRRRARFRLSGPGFRS